MINVIWWKKGFIKTKSFIFEIIFLEANMGNINVMPRNILNKIDRTSLYMME